MSNRFISKMLAFLGYLVLISGIIAAIVVAFTSSKALEGSGPLAFLAILFPVCGTAFSYLAISRILSAVMRANALLDDIPPAQQKFCRICGAELRSDYPGDICGTCKDIKAHTAAAAKYVCTKCGADMPAPSASGLCQKCSLEALKAAK